MSKLDPSQLSNLQELANKWSPIIYLHSAEKYFPCSANWLLQNSVLFDFNTNPIIATSPVTNIDMYNLAKKYNFERRVDGDLILSFDNEIYSGENPLKNVPCYCLIRKQNDKTYITYIFLFTYNGEYSILGLANAGYHPADIEHITVELDSSNNLSRVFYSAHGVKDGRWVKASDIEMEDGRIVAYMALHGHGLYQQEGTVFRLYGLANDYLDKGHRWVPQANLIFQRTDPNFDINTMGWTTFNGRLGGSQRKGDTSGITGLADKAWMNEIDNTDETFYQPPVIIKKKLATVLSAVKDFFYFTMLYFIVVVAIKFINKNIVQKSKIKKYKLKDHLLTIVSLLFFFYILRKIGTAIIQHYAPS
jgi:hypothetical protein